MVLDFSTRMEQRINAEGRGLKKLEERGEFTKIVPLFSVLICVFLLFHLSACSSKPTDLRTLTPAETLVYLETNDLGAALQPIVDNAVFEQVAKKKPDFSALKGVQLAVAVTGFETSEEKLTDEHSVGRVQPHFVAIADTHAWQFQTVRFAEQKLGALVAQIYDSEPTLEKSEKSDGRFFTWTSAGGRKAYALVKGRLIYFGNDESAIDKCLAVRRGEADSIVKTGKVALADPATLASGYVSPDGIAQIANIVGLKFASEMSEDSEVQSAIAGILPQLLRGSITDISWTATKKGQGYEEKYKITTPPEIAKVFSETLTPPSQFDTSVFDFFPADGPAATFYNLKDPQIAWRSVLLTAQKRTDPLAGKVIGEFSGALFEPYGIRDPEMFLNAVSAGLLAVKFDDEGDEPVVIAMLKDIERAKKSLVAGLKPNKQMTDETGVEVLKSEDGEIAAAFVENRIVTGDAEGVLKCLKARGGDNTYNQSGPIARLFQTDAATTTLGRDKITATALVELLSEKRSDSIQATSAYTTETRFTRTGIERRTVSDFGLIGSIIAQLNAE